jgi:membrane protease YdiL (CAAX protease family)
MSEKKIFPEPLEALIVVLVTFSLLFLLIFVYGKLSGAEDAVEMMNNARAIYIFGGLLFVIFPGVYARVKGYSLQRVFRLNPVPSGMILWSLVVGLSLAVVGDELDRIVQIVIPSPEWLNEMLLPLKAKSTLDWVKVILGAVLIAAFSEEFLFRGFLQKSLEIKGDVTRAVLLTSITWALIHQNPYWAIQIFIVGIIIGFVAWRADSIYPSMTVHALYNFIGVIFVNMDEQNGLVQWYTWKDHVNPLLVIVALAVLIYALRAMNRIYRHP